MKRLMNDDNASEDPYIVALLSLRAAVEFGFERVDVRLGRIEDRVGGIEVRLGAVEVRLGAVEGRLAGVEGRMAGLEVRLGHVERRHERVEDTVDTLRNEMRGEFVDLKKRVTTLEARP
jgi:hypothetical protein